MSTPSYVTQSNVYADGRNLNVIVISAGPPESVIVWDALSVADQNVLNTAITAYSTTLPIAATSAYQTINVGGAISGSTATGLANDATVYQLYVNLHGTIQKVLVTGSAAQTMTALVTAVNADLTGVTLSIANGNLKLTDSTTPSAAGQFLKVSINSDGLFRHLTGYAGLGTAYPGVFSTADFFNTVTINGGKIADRFPVVTVLTGNHTTSATTITASTAATSVFVQANTVISLTMAHATTLSFANAPAAGVYTKMSLFSKQNGTGGFAITWPTSVKWAAATAPTQTTTANALDVYTFETIDGGVTWVGIATAVNVH